MMKILLWAPFGSGLHYWGPGISAFNLYNNKSFEYKYSVSLAHSFKNQKVYPIFENQYYLSGLDNYWKFNYILYYLRVRHWIKANKNKFDLVHILGAYHHSFYPALFFEKHNIPTVVKITSVNEGFQGGSIISELLGLRRFRLKNSKRISKYIAISSDIRKSLIDLGIEEQKIAYIPNGVNTSKYKPLIGNKGQYRKAIGLPDCFTVLFTGAICKRKNSFLLVKSFISHFNNRHDIQLILIGPQREKKESDRINKILQVYRTTNVKIIPHISDLYQYYKSADIFILPSSKEGLSNSLLEAQSSGLPAITTYVSGSKDVVEEGCNGTFINLDEKEIADTIMQYYNDPERKEKESINARRLMEQKFDDRLIFEKHIRLFNDLITSK